MFWIKYRYKFILFIVKTLIKLLRNVQPVFSQNVSFFIFDKFSAFSEEQRTLKNLDEL